MLILAIDTAGPDCAVAILRDGQTLARASERIGRGHSERLMPMIAEALAAAHVSFADLDRVAVTTGPGSFTGVRIGVAAARGLALALDIPAVGVGSLEALALPILRSRKEGTVVAVLDAKRDEIYALTQDIASGEISVAAQALPVDMLARLLGNARRPLVFVGAVAPQVARKLAGPAIEIAATPESPDIEDVARLGESAEAGLPPAPLYARGADAKPQADKALPSAMSPWGRPPFSLRSATVADCDDLSDVHGSAFRRGWSGAEFESLLSQPGTHALIAHDRKRRPAGFILYRLVADEAEVLTIAVRPDTRRRGIGRALLEDALRHVYRDGARGIYLEVEDSNHAAITLYRGVEFRETARRAGYYAEGRATPAGALVMLRQLR